MAEMRRKRRSYKFTDNKLSIRGVIAIGLDATAIILMISAIATSVSSAGEGSMYVGSRGVLAWIFAIAGLVVGILGMQEKNTFKNLPKAGMLIGLVAVILFAALYIVGLA